MLKRLIKVIVFGLILGIILSFGVAKYQSDQDIIHDRIARIQQQQIMIIQSVDNPLPTLIKKVASSVVYIEAPGRWCGSGVIIGPHTILTAKHIIQDANELYIETADGKKYNAISWVKDEKNDCGLLFFDPREKFKNISEFADSDRLQIGSTVFIIASPFGKELLNTATLGIISGLNRKISYFGTCELITSDATGNPGISGGPVFNMRGKVIGIVVGTKRRSHGLRIIIPSNICRRLYDKKASKTEIRKSDSFDQR